MKYLLGIDFGTLSCRTVLVSQTGTLINTAVMDYPHGCIDGPNSAVYQDPQDYLDCLRTTVRQAAAGYEDRIASLCIDFTACTMLPVDSSLRPLDKARLWKSHSATRQAAQVNEACARLGMDLSCYGGSVSSEWMIPKMLEIRDNCPEIFARTTYFLEAADWLVWLLTGCQVRSACFAGFKGQWAGQWPLALLEALALDPSTLAGEVRPAGSFAGCLNTFGAEFLGLPRETAVAVSVIDAHAALPAAGVCQEGDMMLILGTSACDLTLSKRDACVPGLYGKVMDGILPGYYVYEGGTPCLGDMFGWFMNNCVPHRYYEQAQGDVFGYMEQLASRVTEPSVWAIDWLNGSRSPYLDPSLTGSLFGLTLRTRPEDIYRALLEAAAFNTRQVVDRLEQQGVTVNRVIAGGGIPKKNGLFMQILANVLGKPILLNENEPASAMGAAVLAAWGGGLYETPESAVAAMAGTPARSVLPHPDEGLLARYRRYCETADHMAIL